jgi:hypothetical protein
MFFNNRFSTFIYRCRRILFFVLFFMVYVALFSIFRTNSNRLVKLRVFVSSWHSYFATKAQRHKGSQSNYHLVR